MDKIKLCAFFLFYAICSCTSDSTVNLGDGYTYRDEGEKTKDIYHEKPALGGEIPATIVSYDYNSNFIIAKQKPKIPQDPLYEKTYIYHKGDSVIYFWLIVKNTKKIFGPLDEKEFERLKKKYSVPNSLSL